MTEKKEKGKKEGCCLEECDPEKGQLWRGLLPLLGLLYLSQSVQA
jgi:hypothetical protein